MKKITSHSINNHRFMKCPLLTALAHQRFLCCALPAWVTDMQAMHPKSPHVSGRTAWCPMSESRAPLAARPAEHASVPHSNASKKPTRVEAEKPTLDTCLFMTGPTSNASPSELLPSAVYLISYLNEAKHRPRIAHLHCPPISSTILSTLTMAYEE